MCDVMTDDISRIGNGIEKYQSDLLKFLEECCNIKLLPFNKLILQKFIELKNQGKDITTITLSMPRYYGRRQLQDAFEELRNSNIL